MTFLVQKFYQAFAYCNYDIININRSSVHGHTLGVTLDIWASYYKLTWQQDHNLLCFLVPLQQLYCIFRYIDRTSSVHRKQQIYLCNRQC